MIEFIIWDKKAQEFPDNICLNAELSQDGISYSAEVKEELFELFYPIGLKDINGKSIYADSSIVEIAHIGKMSNNWVSKKGIFVFINKYLQYIFIEIGINTDGIEIESMFHKLTSFKIIDTIQENKLGLIK